MLVSRPNSFHRNTLSQTVPTLKLVSLQPRGMSSESPTTGVSVSDTRSLLNGRIADFYFVAFQINQNNCYGSSLQFVAADKALIPRKDYDDYTKYVNETNQERRYVNIESLLTLRSLVVLCRKCIRELFPTQQE